MIVVPRRIIVSGFEPFGRASENPTLDVLDQLERRRDFPGALTTVRQPVEANRIAAVAERVLDEVVPDLWIGLGLAMGSAVVAIERIAANVLDFSIPDNAGARPLGEPVFADGPAAYLATLPVRAIVADLRRRGIPAKVSNSASTYLCNQLMFTVLHLIEVKALPTRAGFIHVPAHPALAARQDHTAPDMPSMAIDLMTEAVLAAVRLCLDGGQAAS